MTKQYSTIIVLGLLSVVIIMLAFVTYRIVTREHVAESAAGQALLGDSVAFTTVTGAPVETASLVGKQALYINAWASWSPLSRDELIALNQVAGEYKDAGITFVALNRKEPRELAERYLATLPPLPNLMIIIDTNDHFYSQVGGYAMPETLIYTETGELWRHERQPQSAESMRALIESYRNREAE